MNLDPVQDQLVFIWSWNSYLQILTDLYTNKKLPNKILLSGAKGIGKSTLAYHIVNFILSL